jgi:uncharacterized protein (TIGR02996 family)
VLAPEVVALARDEQWQELLAVLLAAFRVTPAAPLAAAIRATSARAIADTTRTIGSDAGQRAQRLEKRVPGATPVVLGRLLAETAELRFAKRIDALAAIREHGDDPRWSDELLAVVADPPLASSALESPRYDAMWSLLERAGGIRERLAAIAWPNRGPVRDTRPDLAELDRRRERVLAVLAPTPVLSESDAATCDAVLAAQATPSPRVREREQQRAALLAAIYADPAAREPKAIFADWLQEHADPRGEFIALQLASPSLTPRERALISTYDAQWRHPFPAAARHVEYKDGFPIRASYDGPMDGDPAWATITSARRAPVSDGVRVPLLVEITEATDLDIVHLAKLTRPLAVRTLRWRQSPHAKVQVPATETWTALDRITVLPELTTLEVYRWVATADQLRRILAAPLARRLDTFMIDLNSSDVVAAFAAVVAAPALTAACLRIGRDSASAATWWLRRDPAGRLAKLSGTVSWRTNDPELAEFLRELEKLPADAISSVDLQLGYTTAQDDFEPRLRRALQRQTLTRFHVQPWLGPGS